MATADESKNQVSSRIASSVHDINSEKPPFGSRFLTDEADVWSQNAWDHVPPPDDQDDTIAAALAKQQSAPVPEDERAKYNENPAKHWDNFYKMNASNFFKTRKWLHLEFPELVAAAKPEAGPLTIAEIGCGTGSAVFPLLSANENPNLALRAYDYSNHAIKLVQTNPLYLEPPVGSINAAVWDLSSNDLPPEMEPGSVDIITMIFVLSALHPHEWAQAIANVHRLLKPGGLVLFRDYGRYDLTQLRFKSGRLLDENFYIRGDKTRVYFFELGTPLHLQIRIFSHHRISDELALLFTGSPVPSSFETSNTESTVEDDESTPTPQGAHTPSDSSPGTPQISADPPTNPIEPSFLETKKSHIHTVLKEQTNSGHPLFAIDQLGVDRRLIVNRKRQLKMYRVWMQGKFRKL
ncbi:methyltransferase [Irpex rosettiformis]|uniref:Methyltransferase n=1 Tax=Irpex rosettiformis TaxID=378272 RepID=A0ACB8UBJ0_9APHY|nr:methyltransferase [Irpex rosettiformis]